MMHAQQAHEQELANGLRGFSLPKVFLHSRKLLLCRSKAGCRHTCKECMLLSMWLNMVKHHGLAPQHMGE